MRMYGIIILFCLLLYVFLIYCNKKLKEKAEKGVRALVVILSPPVLSFSFLSKLVIEMISLSLTSVVFLILSSTWKPLLKCLPSYVHEGSCVGRRDGMPGGGGVLPEGSRVQNQTRVKW